MTKVALRAYNHEIESLIEQGQRLDEAVAHCRHILASFPKHLDTYRLLGKAYLEGKRHDEAIDIFQRVLVSAPDDFVSHVGMSIIADDQGKLDEAIWHMERAFEVQPSNAAIQAELQRLFGRRDGVEPPKIRLTRGALAHMYVQGELYTQAISEIRAVLANDSERMDMQVLLAQAYFRNGQKAEAADVCAALLAISPYCLDANRITAEILPGTQAAETAQECRRRVLDLDPYAEYAKGSLFATDTVPDGSVTLDRLEPSGEADEPRAGAVMSLASSLRAAETAEPVPSWLSSAGQPAAAMEAALQSEPDQDQDLPEFLRSSGWREVPAESPDEPGSTSQAGEPALESESDALPGELPEWVRALAPNEDEAPADAFSQEISPNSHQSVGPGSTDTSIDAAVAPSSDTPDWLRELAKGAEPPDETASSQHERNPAAPTKSSGASTGRDASPESESGLAWLEGLAEKHGAKPEELITPPDERKATPPEWIGKLGEDQAAASEGWKPIEERPIDSEPTGAASHREQPPSTSGSALDWLSGLADPDAFSGMEKQAEDDPMSLSGSAPSTTEPAPEPQHDLPDWLAENAQEAPTPSPATGREPSSEYESNVDLPDWLADLDGVQGSSAPAVPAEDVAPKVPEWLQPAAQQSEPGGGASQWRPRDTDGSPAEQPAFPQTESSPSQPKEAARFSAEAGQQGPPAVPLRIRPVPQAPAADASSLAGAKAEMARGNIAAALNMYGGLIRKGKSLTEIIRELRDALYRYPVEVPIWQALGDAYMRANRLQEALDAYTKAEELLR